MDFIFCVYRSLPSFKTIIYFSEYVYSKGISNLIEEFFTIPNDIVLIVFIVMCALIFICSLIPIKKVQQIEIIDALKSWIFFIA